MFRVLVSTMESSLKSSFPNGKNAKNAFHILEVNSNIQDLIHVSMFVLCHIVMLIRMKDFSRKTKT